MTKEERREIAASVLRGNEMKYWDMGYRACEELNDWIEWGKEYPSSSGLYCVVIRKTRETWIAYWQDSKRRFEEIILDNESGLDVTHWRKLPTPPINK